MAATFTTEKKRQQIFIVVFILVVIAIGLVIWQGYFRQKETTVTPFTSVSPWREIEFNFQKLERLKDFSPFQEIEEWLKEVGRENPFQSY
ncbi:MAG: hypothetical protein ACPLW9_02745 [Minisyncoccales bacterium]